MKEKLRLDGYENYREERKLYAADVKSFDKANFQFAGRFRVWI